MKKLFTPEEILKACIAYYAQNECSDFNASVTARFINTDNEDFCVELYIEKELALDDNEKKSTRILN